MVDLGFDISLGGRTAKPISAEIIRELKESDLALLSVERGIQPTAVQRISSRHHALARALATGEQTIQEICLTLGYTSGRISVLKSDPSFQELIAHYTKVKSELVVDLQDRMAQVALAATEEIQHRLETEPETLGVDALLDMVKVTADRTGHGPKSTNVNVNVNLGDRLRAARERAGAASPSHEVSLAPAEFKRLADES